MKFIHIADLHLGMEPDKGHPWSKTRSRELWDAFENVIAECRRTNADILLIAGDLFHRQPLIRELKEVNSLLASVPDTRTVIIAGNHDYISGTSGYRRFEWAENVSFLMSDKTESIYFEDINTEIYGFSYHTRDYYGNGFGGLKASDPGKINILIGHGGEPSKMPVDWKELERAGFDYVAMGHLHKPQDISEKIRFSGSLEPLDKNENGEHGYIRGEIIKNGTVSQLKTERVFSAKRQYIKEEITLTADDTNTSVRRMVRDLIESRGSDNYYILTFSGEYDPQIRIDLEGLDDLGNIIETIDFTRPRLDLEQLVQDNAGNVIGLFIDSFRNKNKEGASSPEVSTDERRQEIENRALYFGVQALSGYELK